MTRDKIRALIKTNRTTQIGLAEESGVSKDKINTFLNKRGHLWPHELFKIAQWFRVSTDWLCDDSRSLSDGHPEVSSINRAVEHGTATGHRKLDGPRVDSKSVDRLADNVSRPKRGR